MFTAARLIPELAQRSVGQFWDAEASLTLAAQQKANALTSRGRQRGAGFCF
jgi:hypothetical protein